MDNIKTAYAIEKGRRHEWQGIECQDNISIGCNKNVKSVVLCDGAGSCMHSEIASCYVSKSFSNYIIDNFEMIFNSCYEDISSNLDMIISNCMKSLESTYMSLAECCCTLVAVAVSEDGRWLTFHVGDGIIFLKEDKIRVVSQPENGEYSNITYFLNDSNLRKHFRINYGQLNTGGGFLLTSDGCSDLLYDLSNDYIADGVEIMLSWLRDYDEKEVSKTLKLELKELFSNHSDDDLSIGMIMKL